MRSRSCALLAAALALFLLEVSYAATTGTVQGRVTGAEGGQPIEGANVFLLSPATAAAAATTVTDKSGYYVFTGVIPGAYTLRAEIVTFKPAQSPVTVTQDITSTLDFSLEKEVLDAPPGTISRPRVDRTRTYTQYPVSAQQEQRTKQAGPGLYQFTSLLIGQPGVSFDAFGSAHLRGADAFQTGYLVDGINTMNPITNEFGTNLVTIGLRAANLYAGAADASYGGAFGFLNLVTANGRDIRGAIVELTSGPASGYGYSGIHSQFGSVTPDGRFDYYGSLIASRNKFPGQTSVESQPVSADALLKLSYSSGPADTTTLFLSQGFAHFNWFPADPSRPASDDLVFERGLGTAVHSGRFQQPNDDQGYSLNYLAVKHSFTPGAFLSYRLYRLYSFLDRHFEAVDNHYRRDDATVIGSQLDYTQQIGPAYQFRAGLHRIASRNRYRVVEEITGAVDEAPESGYLDRGSQVHADQWVLYTQNQIKPGDRVTVDLGLRWASQRYSNLKVAPAFTDSYLDPRLGVAYAPGRDLVLRTSYAHSSQFPETRYLGYLAPANGLDWGGGPTATNPQAQAAAQNARYATHNRLRESHVRNFDLGFEKAFAALGGEFSLGLTGFRRRSYDLIQLNQASYTGSPFPLRFSNDSKGHADGIEMILSKRQQRPSDLNGFLSYTRQHVRATSSFSDTGYIPYFGFAVTDPSLTEADYARLNRREFPTSYDQRHTITLFLNKRISKTIEISGFLDAGSGYPFTGGAPADGVFGGGADAQHGEKAFTLGKENFAQVPVVLFDNRTLTPLHPVAGISGWHCKVTVNANFYIDPNRHFFLNVDNLFNQSTVLNPATIAQNGAIYYREPTAEYPQGQIFYGPSTVLEPRFIAAGMRFKF